MQLNIHNLTKTYPGQASKALYRINLTIGQGLFGLLGQNGAGKSTLMRIIATLQPPDEGTIFFDNIDVLNQTDDFRRLLGYLPQEFGVYPTATAQELLDHIADLKGYDSRSDRKIIVEELLWQVNLWEVRQQPMGTFSGGMRQRFGIAQALLGQPRLIIVDEPTAGLDPTERNRFYNLLAQIGETAVVILSTHLIEDVSTLCSRMAILDQGTLLMVDTPQAIINQFMGRLWERAITRSELIHYQSKYQVINQRFQFGQLWVTLLAEQQPDVACQAKRPTLEDAYFACIV